MKAYLEKFFLMCLVVFAWPLMAATISGTVKDSSKGNPIVGAKVKCSTPVCSTQTDAAGKFNLPILVTDIFPSSVPQVAMKIYFDPSRNSFYGNGREDFSIVLRNVRGEVILRGDKLSLGEYFASWRTTRYSGVFKFSNITGQRWFSVQSRAEIKGMAKVMAGYSVNFAAPSYSPKTVTLNVGQNAQIDLVQISGSLSITDSLGHIGQEVINVIVPPVSPSP